MKKLNCLFVFLLVAAMLLSSCGTVGNLNGDSLHGGNMNNADSLHNDNTDGTDNGDDHGSGAQVSTLPDSFFAMTEKQGVIGSIIQTGDGNAYVNGTVPSPRIRAARSSYAQSESDQTASSNKHLVTLEHAFGTTCYVSGYIGSSLYIIQDHGSLGWNKKGIGHKDGTLLLPYGDEGYFSISSMTENKIIVGDPTDTSVESMWDSTDSYMFGYMVYDPDTRELVPMYAENNLRFYTAGYFINGVAMVSVKENGRILFGIIDSNGNYVVEPQYEMMADESISDAVIVAVDAERVESQSSGIDCCGRAIWYDSTLMTNVQTTRYYECTSQTVGLISTLTGESILPCRYAYIERVTGDTYFVVDNEGARFLYDAATNRFADVEEGIYSYFNAEWMIYVDSDDVAYLADKDLNLYKATGLAISGPDSRYYNAQRCVNTNVVSAVRDESSEYVRGGRKMHEGIGEEYDSNTRKYHLTVTATGDVIENVNSYTYLFNGGFLYTVENSLYRYDIASKTSTRIETGYGNFTEDHDNRGVSYHASLGQLDTGVFLLRYNIEYRDGTGYLMIIVNDMGKVLFDAAINSVEQLTKNYLGKYDDALYELAGGTEISDNYYLTRDDGAHFLIQFVRGNVGHVEGEDASRLDHTRTVDNFTNITMLSPFTLDFTNGNEISVNIGDAEIPSECYVYDRSTQSFKLLLRAFDCDFTMLERMRADGFLEITVTSGEETVTLRIEVSPFALDF